MNSTTTIFWLVIGIVFSLGVFAVMMANAEPDETYGDDYEDDEL